MIKHESNALSSSTVQSDLLSKNGFYILVTTSVNVSQALRPAHHTDTTGQILT